MKALQLCILLLLITTPLCAEQALVLTEIERIQEKIWYLQKDLVEQKASLQEQQKHLQQLSNKTEAAQADINERLASQLSSVETLTSGINRTLADLAPVPEALAALTDQFVIQNNTIQEQSGQIGALQDRLQTLQSEFSSLQEQTSKTLAEMRAQVDETRLKIDSLGQDVGGRVEQISLWGMAAALILAVMLVFIIVSRKDKRH